MSKLLDGKPGKSERPTRKGRCLSTTSDLSREGSFRGFRKYESLLVCSFSVVDRRNDGKGEDPGHCTVPITSSNFFFSIIFTYLFLTTLRLYTGRDELTLSTEVHWELDQFSYSISFNL